MKAPSPAFSFYPKDILSDGPCLAMTDEELGVYLRLLCVCWLEGSLPADPVRLARIVRRSPRSFARLWIAIGPCFERRGDELIQCRLEREKAKQLARSKGQSEKANKRWKSNDSNAEVMPRHRSGMAPAHAPAMPRESLPSPSPLTDNGSPPSPPVPGGDGDDESAPLGGVSGQIQVLTSLALGYGLRSDRQVQREWRRRLTGGTSLDTLRAELDAAVEAKARKAADAAAEAARIEAGNAWVAEHGGKVQLGREAHEAAAARGGPYQHALHAWATERGAPDGALAVLAQAIYLASLESRGSPSTSG